MNTTRLSVAILILRVGLGGFLLLWSIDKLVTPEGAVAIYQFFYHVSITTEIAYVIGAFELLLSLAIMAGFLKTYSYGLGLLLHVTSTIASYQQLLNPFGGNHLYIAAIPVLAGFIALFLIRRQDNLWSLDAAWRK
ncbi:MAG: DoxX family membrane protein [Gammaproteobacteria bacterium]